jgi:hypothetical protein
LELTALTSADKRANLGRALANLLSSQPGFVAFVAIDTRVKELTGLYIFDDRESLDAAYGHLVQWHATHTDESAWRVKAVSTGEIVAQRGL